MMYRPSRQRGMTLIGWVFVLGLIGFFTLLSLTLAPIYLEHLKVKSALESLKEEPFITRKSKMDIKKMLRKRFDIDDVTTVKKENISISKKNGKLNIVIEYERREPAISNVDVVVKFRDDLEVVAN